MLNALVVEDHKEFRDLLVDVLQAEFSALQVTGVASGEQALKQVDRRPPDLVFLDIKLPGMSGLEVAQKLRGRFRDIVIVVLTSYDTHEYREVAAKHDVDHFLVKGSSTRSDIIELVKSILADRLTP